MTGSIASKCIFGADERKMETFENIFFFLVNYVSTFWSHEKKALSFLETADEIDGWFDTAVWVDNAILH